MTTKVKLTFKPDTSEATRDRLTAMAKKLANADEAIIARQNNANALLRTIAGCGRRFFSHEGRISYFVLDEQGRLCFRDKHSNELLLCRRTNSNRWHVRFTEGGTLKALVEALIEYINHAKPVPSGHLGPWPSWVCDGDLWGYGDDMNTVRAKARELNIIGGPNTNWHPTD